MERVYLGLDESNHGNNPEVVVGVFSKIPADADTIQRTDKKKLLRSELEGFFMDDRRSWSVAAIPRSLITPHTHPLVQAAPYLVGPFLSPGRGETEFHLFFDGEVRNMWEASRAIEEYDGAKVRSVQCFPKKKRVEGAYNYNQLLSVADTMASLAYRKLYNEKELDQIEVRQGGILL